VKILDFGIARVRDAAQDVADARTGNGVLLGTPAFMAPEQAAGWSDGVDARTDLWSAGATLFTLLSGRPVHPAADLRELLVRASSSRAPSLREALPAARPRLVALVDRALAFEREGRWPDAASMRVAVRRAYREVFGQRIAPVGLLRLLVKESQAEDARAEEPPSHDTLREDVPPGAMPPSSRSPASKSAGRTAPLATRAARLATPPPAEMRRLLSTLAMPERPSQQGSISPVFTSGTSTTTAPPTSTDPFAPRVPASTPPPRLTRPWRLAAGGALPLAAAAVLLAAFRVNQASPAGVASAAPLGAAAAAMPMEMDVEDEEAPLPELEPAIVPETTAATAAAPAPATALAAAPASAPAAASAPASALAPSPSPSLVPAPSLTLTPAPSPSL
ncbi:MAG TPA: hypothetical protein VIY73_00685, partial [Polyangiaceae bacterium]